MAKHARSDQKVNKFARTEKVYNLLICWNYYPGQQEFNNRLGLINTRTEQCF